MGANRRRDGKCTESGRTQNLLRSRGTQDPESRWAGQVRDLGWAWKSSQGDRAQPHPRAVRKGKGLMEWGESVWACV